MRRFTSWSSLLFFSLFTGFLSCQNSVDVSPKQAADLTTLQKAIFATKEYGQITNGINQHLAQVRQRVQSLSIEDQRSLQAIRGHYATAKELATQMTPAEKAILFRVFSTPLQVDIRGLSNSIERQLGERYTFTKQDFVKAMTLRSAANGKVAQGCTDAASDYYYYTLRVLIEEQDMAPIGPETTSVVDLLAQAYYDGCIAGGGQP